LRRLGAASLLVLSAFPLAARAQPVTPSQERTGPQAAPPQRPPYAQPAPGLIAPPPPAAPAAPAVGGRPITEVRVASDGPHGAAMPPKGWRPPDAGGADLKLEHAPGQALDEAWVRRQFELNGLPGGGVGRALALVQLVNRAYLSAGFINSGLVVRPQPAPDVLDLRVVYGGLTAPAEGVPPISVAWNGGHAKGLTADYVRDRLPSTRQRPLNAQALERDFRLLAEDPAIRTVNADLRPGSRPGEASLGVSVYPQDRFDLYVTAANDRSPSVGGERASVGGSIRNAVWAGDVLSAEGGITDGVEDAAASYAVPFLSPRNTLSIHGGFDDAAVVDSGLRPLDITAKERFVEGGLSRKLIDAPLLPSARAGRWSSARTLTVGGLIAWRQSTSTLLGERFSFAPGAVNGRSEYTALRLVGDYVVRNVDQVFAISLTGTVGLDGTRTDIPGLENPSQHFVAALAQVNYARRLDSHGLELRARLSGQWADGVLYSGERFSAGGETTVRGYRETLLLTDEGVIGSIEIARPISLSGRQGAGKAFDWGAFTLAGFVDGALVRNKTDPQPDHRIYSVGGSLTWTPAEALSARITFAEALKDVEVPGSRDLQDRGISFRVTVRPLRLFR
jgi:hemolysin activation/secretion protein